jgi:hypothetical protein
MSLSSVLSSSSKVTPSKGRNQNNSSAVGDHGQPDPTAGGGQVADDIETADIKQGAKESPLPAPGQCAAGTRGFRVCALPPLRRGALGIVATLGNGREKGDVSSVETRQGIIGALR